jgi:hypothetical protein
MEWLPTATRTSRIRGRAAGSYTSVFSQLPAYTARTNPWLYDGLTGPGMLNVDTSLTKSFFITEKMRFVLRMGLLQCAEQYDVADPDTNFYSSTFGQSTNQLGNTFGRRTQLGLRVEF